MQYIFDGPSLDPIPVDSEKGRRILAERRDAAPQSAQQVAADGVQDADILYTDMQLVAAGWSARTPGPARTLGALGWRDKMVFGTSARLREPTVVTRKRRRTDAGRHGRDSGD